MSEHGYELGLDSFIAVTADQDGVPIPGDQVIRNVVEEAVLADSVGVDFFGIGEHHRDDFAVTAPEVVLAAIASKTERIRLGTAVTVLSSDDPVRVFEKFATLTASRTIISGMRISPGHLRKRQMRGKTPFGEFPAREGG